MACTWNKLIKESICIKDLLLMICLHAIRNWLMLKQLVIRMLLILKKWLKINTFEYCTYEYVL